MSSSSSGRHINGQWIPSNQPKANLSTPPSSPQKVRRRPYASKTKRPGLKKAIKAAFKAGNTPINKIMEEILPQGFQLSKSSINTIMCDQKIGARYKERANKKDSTSKTCNQKVAWEDES